MTHFKDLQSTILKLAVRGKGILAADESEATITKRFQAVGIESTPETRRAYREMLITSPNFNDYIAGVILFEETLNQNTSQGISFPQALNNMGVLAGIKVDKGLIPLSYTDEKITQGLDGLSERLLQYKAKGATFAKWRAVYSISTKTPTSLAIEENANILANYAAICQQAGIVPIVEPEVLIDGDHTLTQCEDVSLHVFHAVFHALYQHKVRLEYIVLKPSMVINGKDCMQKTTVDDVANATLGILKQTVPCAVPTINFLSGGQTQVLATAHLNAMNQKGVLPWNLSFSYARALQEDAMKIWQGQSKNVLIAQQAFTKRARLNSLAAQGKYVSDLEKETIPLAS